MLKNEAKWDRILRVVLGIAAAIGGVSAGGALAVVGVVVGVILIVTGAIGWCPIYAALRTGTLRRNSSLIDN